MSATIVNDTVRDDATIVVQLTDTHIGPSGTTPYGTDTAANLRRVAATIRRMGLEPDAVLLTGDLTDKGDADSYAHLRQIVDEELVPLGCPVLPVVGNHDHRGTFRRAFLGEDVDDDEIPYRYVHDLEDVRLVMCDSYVAGRTTGLLGGDQLRWLDEQLAGRGDRVALVALHHPSVPRGVPRPDDFLLEDRDAFEAVISRNDVGAVLCGHAHVSTATAFAGTLHAAAPATAFLLDPSKRSGARAFEASGFTICTVRGGRTIVNPFILEPDGALLRES